MGISAKRRLQESPPQPQMIIQCPSCQTKFALDAGVLEDISDPRFHCSRCDNVFTVEEVKSPKAVAAPEPTRKETRTTESIAPNARSFEIPNGLLKQNTASTPQETDDEDIEILPWEKGADAEQLEIPFSAASPTATTPVQKEQQRSLEFSREPAKNGDIDESDSLAALHSRSMLDDDFQSDTLPETSSFEHDRDTPIPSSPLPPELNSATDFQSGSVTYPGYSPRLETSAPTATAAVWKGLATCALPILGFLIILSACGFYLRSHAQTASELSRTLLPAVPQIAPADLFLKNTRFRKVALESGEAVYVISGRIVNDSSQSFRDVLVEGLAFDGRGVPVMRTKISASSALAKSRIKSLTPDLIEKTQQTSTPKDFRVDAGAAQDFVIVMNDGKSDPSLAKARYFSARIYSVRH